MIDVNYYPVEAARRSNLRHRPIGTVCRDFAWRAFILLRMPSDSDEALELNKEFTRPSTNAAMTASKDLLKVEGPYET